MLAVETTSSEAATQQDVTKDVTKVHLLSLTHRPSQTQREHHTHAHKYLSAPTCC